MDPLHFIEQIRNNIRRLLDSKCKTKYIKGEIKYLPGKIKYTKGENVYQEKTDNYDYIKYVLVIFILLIFGFVVISVIKDMNKITDKINAQKLTPETISEINTNIAQNRNIVKTPNLIVSNINNIQPNLVKEDEKLIVQKPIIQKPKPIVEKPKQKPIIKKPINKGDNQKQKQKQKQNIKGSSFEFCWFKENSDDNTCYLF